MRALKVLALCGALAATAVGILLQKGTEDTPPGQAISLRPAAALAFPVVPTEPLKPSEIADYASPVLPTEPHPQDARTAPVTPQMMERFHEMAGGAFIEYLMERGLSQSDGERVVAQSFQEGIACSARSDPCGSGSAISGF